MSKGREETQMIVKKTNPEISFDWAVKIYDSALQIMINKENKNPRNSKVLRQTWEENEANHMDPEKLGEEILNLVREPLKKEILHLKLNGRALSSLDHGICHPETLKMDTGNHGKFSIVSTYVLQEIVNVSLDVLETSIKEFEDELLTEGYTPNLDKKLNELTGFSDSIKELHTYPGRLYKEKGYENTPLVKKHEKEIISISNLKESLLMRKNQVFLENKLDELGALIKKFSEGFLEKNIQVLDEELKELKELSASITKLFSSSTSLGEREKDSLIRKHKSKSDIILNLEISLQNRKKDDLPLNAHLEEIRKETMLIKSEIENLTTNAKKEEIGNKITELGNKITEQLDKFIRFNGKTLASKFKNQVEEARATLYSLSGFLSVRERVSNLILSLQEKDINDEALEKKMSECIGLDQQFRALQLDIDPVVYQAELGAIIKAIEQIANMKHTKANEEIQEILSTWESYKNNFDKIDPKLLSAEDAFNLLIKYDVFLSIRKENKGRLNKLQAPVESILAIDNVYTNVILPKVDLVKEVLEQRVEDTNNYLTNNILFLAKSDQKIALLLLEVQSFDNDILKINDALRTKINELNSHIVARQELRKDIDTKKNEFLSLITGFQKRKEGSDKASLTSRVSPKLPNFEKILSTGDNKLRNWDLKLVDLDRKFKSINYVTSPILALHLNTKVKDIQSAYTALIESDNLIKNIAKEMRRLDEKDILAEDIPSEKKRIEVQHANLNTVIEQRKALVRLIEDTMAGETFIPIRDKLNNSLTALHKTLGLSQIINTSSDLIAVNEYLYVGIEQINAAYRTFDENYKNAENILTEIEKRRSVLDPLLSAPFVPSFTIDSYYCQQMFEHFSKVEQGCRSCEKTLNDLIQSLEHQKKILDGSKLSNKIKEVNSEKIQNEIKLQINIDASKKSIETFDTKILSRIRAIEDKIKEIEQEKQTLGTVFHGITTEKQKLEVFRQVQKQLVESKDFAELSTYATKNPIKTEQINLYFERIRNAQTPEALKKAVTSDPKLENSPFAMRDNTKKRAAIYSFLYQGKSATDAYAKRLENKLNDLLSQYNLELVDENESLDIQNETKTFKANYQNTLPLRRYTEAINILTNYTSSIFHKKNHIDTVNKVLLMRTDTQTLNELLDSLKTQLENAGTKINPNGALAKCIDKIQDQGQTSKIIDIDSINDVIELKNLRKINSDKI